MLERTEHMWCRWCGGFGLTDQMVCSDSDCLTKDMTEGALSGLAVMGTFTFSAMSVSEITSHIQHNVSGRYAMVVEALAHDAKPETIFSKLNIT